MVFKYTVNARVPAKSTKLDTRKAIRYATAAGCPITINKSATGPPSINPANPQPVANVMLNITNPVPLISSGNRSAL